MLGGDSVIRELAEVLSGKEVYVVGGAVRDLLLGRHTDDFDLLLPLAEAECMRSVMSSTLGVKPFPLNTEHGIYRFELKRLGVRIDVSPLDGELTDNLRRRDFTQNAMAMPLEAFVSRDVAKVFDPFFGMADIADRRLRLVGESAFANDPVRILRGGRFCAELGMVPDSNLVTLARASARGLRLSPGERVWTELVRVFTSPDAPRILDFFEEVGVQAVLFPELEGERGITQGQHHSYCVYEHSRKVFAAFVSLWHEPNCFGPELAASIRGHLETMEPGHKAACILGGLLHDIGKPPARTQNDNGRISFYRHEHLGAAMAPPIAQRLRMSKAEGRIMANFIRFHILQAQLARTSKRSDLHLHRIGRILGTISVPMSLFSVADLIGKGSEATVGKDFSQMLEALSCFLSAWFYRFDEVMEPPLPVDGQAIASHLNLVPGRWLREVLEYLSERQAGGAALDKAGALQEAERYLYRQKKK